MSEERNAVEIGAMLKMIIVLKEMTVRKITIEMWTDVGVAAVETVIDPDHRPRGTKDAARKEEQTLVVPDEDLLIADALLVPIDGALQMRIKGALQMTGDVLAPHTTIAIDDHPAGVEVDGPVPAAEIDVT